jgi:hypothetical protein
MTKKIKIGDSEYVIQYTPRGRIREDKLNNLGI